MKISRIEAVCIVVVSLLAVAVLSISAGGPQFSDELAYITPGLNGFKDPLILNRYFHVYIQAIFMQLAPKPILGVRLFWSLEMVFSALMIYLGIRLLNKKATFIHSITGAFFFFSLPFFLTYSGATIVDFTSMVMITGVLIFYLLSIRFENKAKWFLLTMGAMLFLSFKTKELNVVASAAILGLGLDKEGFFHWKLMWEKVRMLLLGVVGGVVIFMGLGALVVHDPLWGFRISEYKLFLQGYFSNFVAGHVPYDYFRELLASFPVFLLFLIGGIHNGDRINRREKVVWFIPFIFVIALTLSYIKSPFGTISRYLIPIFPVMCLFIPQSLIFDIPREKKEKIYLAIAVTAGMVLVTGAVLIYPTISNAIGWDYSEFTNSLVVDVLILAVIIILGWIRNFKKISFALALSGIILLAAQPFQINYRYVIKYRAGQEVYSERISPFSDFSSLIHYTPSMKMLISLDISNSYRLLGRGQDDMVGLFDLYFDKPAGRDNFTVVNDRNELLIDVLGGGYEYVLMTIEDWGFISRQPADNAQIEISYNLEFSDTGKIVFLDKK